MPPTVSPAGEQADAKRYQRWFRDYNGDPEVYDELLADGQKVRPPWVRFLSQLSKQRPKDFEERWENARKVIQENGVTYNVHGDPEGVERPWPLDPLPLVLSADDWDYIQSSLIQRATLFERLLADLHGNREVLDGDGIPPEMVFGNDSFLRPCVGLPSWSNGRPLPFYAADLARSPDGRWWVVSDRTQAPTGMGYALENRIVLGRMLPEVARECQLVRVAGFFEKVRESLVAAAPRPVAQPHIVLLTPGPETEVYFEHAYLARYLGITLAQGEDLTVRDDHVYLKTLDGLRQVDVIWRCVAESASDALELRTDSREGVSGLLQAIRAGNVAVMNPPGSGLVEAPAMMAFLPGLCRNLLGEELIIPSVATWWCGQQEPRHTVLENLEKLVVKHAFHKGSPVLFGRAINAGSREELAASIAMDPEKYVAQEEIPYSTAPVWGDHGFEPRQVVLRVFLVASGDSYAVMPGGLTRVAGGDSEKKSGVLMQQGSGSKDTWVLSDRSEEPQLSAMRNQFPVVIRRGAGQISSRVADNLYWIGRTAERSEFATRLLRCAVGRVGGESGFAAMNEVAPVWDYLVAKKHLVASASRAEPTAKGIRPLEDALRSAIFDRNLNGSLHNLNAELHRLGQAARDSLSADTWRVVARLGDRLQSQDPPARLNDFLPTLDLLVNLHSALSGLSQENFTRTPAWAFLDLGRRLQRANSTAGLCLQLLDCTEADRQNSLDTLLDVFDSSITYRQRYFFEPRLLPVLDTLLLDASNPRSLIFQVLQLDAHLAALPNEARFPYSTAGRRATTSALSQLKTADLNARDIEEHRGRLSNIRTRLESVVESLGGVSEDITHQYFSLLQTEGVAAEALAKSRQ